MAAGGLISTYHPSQIQEQFYVHVIFTKEEWNYLKVLRYPIKMFDPP